MEPEQLYDVVIYDLKTHEVVQITGTKLPLGGGRRSAETRYQTATDRFDMTKCGVDIVETGLFKVGSRYQ